MPGPSPGGPRHQARDLLESEASLLEDAALVKLAYVSLCQRDYSGALRHSRKLLEKNCLLSQPGGSKPHEEFEEVRRNWAFKVQSLPQTVGAVAGSNGGWSGHKCPSSITCVTLAVLYAAEALLVLGKSADAKSLLGSFIKENAVTRGMEYQSTFNLEQHIIGVPGSSRRTSSETSLRMEPNQDSAKSVCGGFSPAGSLGGLTPPGLILQSLGSSASQPPRERTGEGRGGEAGGERTNSSSKDSKDQAALVVYPPSEFTRLGETQCMLYTNLAALHVQDDNLDEAEACCERALQVQPNALAPLRTLVYVLLRRGNHIQALHRLKQSRL